MMKSGVEHTGASRAKLPGLDTLRAVAVLAVLAFHMGGELGKLRVVGQFGWMGVDLFFVLSGYLIGRQLLMPYARGEKPRWGRFFRRRLFRTLPAFYAVVLLYELLPWWREAPGLPPLWQWLTFTRNLLLGGDEAGAFSHAWSLCVEEQFYLLLPLVLWGLMRARRVVRPWMVVVLLVAWGATWRGFVFQHWLRALPPDGRPFAKVYFCLAYQPTYARLDGLLAGVSVAAVELFRPEWWAWLARRAEWCVAVGLAGIVAATWMFAVRFRSVSLRAELGTVIGFPLLAFAMALLVVAGCERKSWLGRARVPGVAALAACSYSLYLSHKGALHVGRQWVGPWLRHRGLPSTVLMLADLALVGVVTTILYLAVERPFLRFREPRSIAVDTASSNTALDPAI